MVVKTVNLLKKILLLLLVINALTLANSTVKVNAQQAKLSVLPSTAKINNPGENVTIDLNITDVTNLYAYEIKIYYLNSIVNATDVVRPPGHFMEPVIDPANQFIPKWEIKNNFNATHGQIWIGFTLLNPEPAKSGSGILAKITFKGLSVGITQVIIAYPGYQYPAKLADNTGSAIPNVAENGTINVVPEFPSMAILIILMLMFTTTYMLKTIRSKKKQ
jgi:hypothetical protein